MTDCNLQLCKFGINCQLKMLEKRIKSVAKNNGDGKYFKPPRGTFISTQKIVVSQPMEKFVEDLTEIYKFQIPVFKSYYFQRKPMIGFFQGKVILRMDIYMASELYGKGEQIFMTHRSLRCDGT